MMSYEMPTLPMGRATAEPEVLCIFGTGDLGRSLGMRLLQSGYRVVYGSRRADSCGPIPLGAEVLLLLRVLASKFHEDEKHSVFFALFPDNFVCLFLVRPGDGSCRGGQDSFPDLPLRSQRTLRVPVRTCRPSAWKGRCAVLLDS